EVDEEGADFAAAICAHDASAADPWAEVFNRPRTAFTSAAANGQPWCDHATPLLTRLASDPQRSDAARAYANALVNLAAATATIAAPNLERINAAGFAASAQLRAITPAQSSVLPTVMHMIRPLLTKDG